MKKCNNCKEVKCCTEFYKRTASADGLQSRCKICQDRIRLKYRPLSTRQKIENLGLDRRFCNMKQRCNNPNATGYKNYGGRGIKVLWKSFQEFKNDMYESYVEHACKYGDYNTTIDRINNDGHYCKENCRWATMKEQRANSRLVCYTK